MKQLLKIAAVAVMMTALGACAGGYGLKERPKGAGDLDRSKIGDAVSRVPAAITTKLP